MKTNAALIMLTLISSSPCFAFIRELALCTTSDNQYTVSVSDNQGTGPVRTSNVSASISDAGGNIVAHYEAEEFHGMQSVSFGRKKYQDTITSGEKFLLEGPSTNFRHYSLNAEMNAGGSSGTISDDNLSCSVFGGAVLQ